MDAAKAKALIKQLKRGKRGWSMTLPKEVGTCLDKRIDISVHTPGAPRGGEPPLTKQEIELLETILLNLPKLAARAERAWQEYGGHSELDEDDHISRPTIWIDHEKQSGRSAGAWTMVVEVAGTDYGWHIQFVRARFKEIWAGS